MVVTALTLWIGYDAAVEIGKLALAENIILKRGGGTTRLRPARGFRSSGRADGESGAACQLPGGGD